MLLMQEPLEADPALPASNNRRWQALLALALLVPMPSIGTAMWLCWWPGTWWAKGGYALCKLWVLVFPALWLVVIERQPLSWSPVRHGGIGVGALLGIAIGIIIIGAYAALGRHFIDAMRFRETAKARGFGTPGSFLILAVYLVCINSLAEEYIWRWFVFRRTEIIWPAAATVLAALLFTVHHVIALAAQFGAALTTIASAGVFVGGWIWSWCYERYRSIWPGYVSHAIVDFAILFLGWKLLFG
jgi:membrane protease YdiL (CAAX protease family)